MRMVTGNLLDIDSGIIVHQVNTEGIMGAGVARQLADKYPLMEKLYEEYCKDENVRSLLGTVQFVTVKPTLMIANCFSQLPITTTQQNLKTAVTANYKLTDEDLLLGRLHKVDKVGKLFGMQVYVPYRIGSGIANGDWDFIKAGLVDTNITIVQREQDM